MIASIGPHRHDQHNIDDSDLPRSLVGDAGIVQRGGLDAGSVPRPAPRKPLAVLPRLPGEENVLRVAYLQNLQIDPHRRTFPFPVQNQFILSPWEPLIECDPDTGQPLPAAAESWVWSEDRLTLTLKLRPNGRWSNGEPVTAQGFVRGWWRLLRQDMESRARR